MDYQASNFKNLSIPLNAMKYAPWRLTILLSKLSTFDDAFEVEKFHLKQNCDDIGKHFISPQNQKSILAPQCEEINYFLLNLLVRPTLHDLRARTTCILPTTSYGQQLVLKIVVTLLVTVCRSKVVVRDCVLYLSQTDRRKGKLTNCLLPHVNTSLVL